MNDLTALARPPLAAELMLSACRKRLAARPDTALPGSNPIAESLAEAVCPSWPSGPTALPRPDALYRSLRAGSPDMRRAQWPRDVQIAALVTSLRQALQTDPDHTIGVLLPWQPAGAREPIDADEYLRLARRLMIRYPGSRLWVQTLDTDVWCKFRDVFGERCSNVWIDDGTPGLGRTPVPGFGPDDWADPVRVSDLQWALLRLLAECRFLVTHTGEWGLWACLTRGQAQGVWQVDAAAGAINPAWPGGWFGACRRWLKRR